MYSVVILFSCLIFMGYSGQAARILAVFPSPMISHQFFFRPLTQELAKRGHEVTVITTLPAFPKGQTPHNLTEIVLVDSSYEIARKFNTSSIRGNKRDMITQTEAMLHTGNVIFERHLQNQEFQVILKKSKDHFDLLILEASARQILVLSHLFEAPVIQVSSFGATVGSYKLMGGPTHPLFYSSPIRQRINNHNLWEKITEYYTLYLMWNLFDKMEVAVNEMLKKNFGPDVPDLSKLKENVDMVFLNMHPLIEGNYPVPQTVQYIWGMHAMPEKELPKDLKDYLDSSKHGVIYMSFGTNTNPTLLPPDKIQIFVRVFSKLPYDVLWKWDGDELPGRTKNIKISKWLPQSDLLTEKQINVIVRTEIVEEVRLDNTIMKKPSLDVKMLTK